MTSHWAFGWQEVAAFANMAAIVFAAWIARRSVHEWRRERLEARQSEVAEQALSLAYQAQEVFDRIRSPGGFVGEGSSRPPQTNETPQEKEARDTAFVPIERLNREGGFFEKVVEIRPRVDALFGRGSAAPFNEFLAVRWEIVGAARMRTVGEQARTTEEHEPLARREREYESIIWKRPHDDQIDGRIGRAIAEVEALAAPRLKSHYRSAG